MAARYVLGILVLLTLSLGVVQAQDDDDEPMAARRWEVRRFRTTMMSRSVARPLAAGRSRTTMMSPSAVRR